MNTNPPVTTPHHAISLALQDRYGMKLASRLADAAQDLPYDIAERLRASRMQALAVRKPGKAMQTAPIGSTTAGWSFSGSSSGASLALRSSVFGLPSGDEDAAPWWTRLVSALPLILLVVGLMTIHSLQDDFRADEIAEVDAALLSDDLPPAAYTDPGFAQFLKADHDRPL